MSNKNSFATAVQLSEKVRELSRWYGQLLCSDDGVPLPILANACIALRNSPPDLIAKPTIESFNARSVAVHGRAYGLKLVDHLQRLGLFVDLDTATDAALLVRLEKGQA
jgi:hypothetical protein